jgi:hypothetical protein
MGVELGVVSEYAVEFIDSGCVEVEGEWYFPGSQGKLSDYFD